MERILAIKDLGLQIVLLDELVFLFSSKKLFQKFDRKEKYLMCMYVYVYTDVYTYVQVYVYLKQHIAATA